MTLSRILFGVEALGGGPLHLELLYPKPNEFNLEAYTDADYDGCKIDRKKHK